MAAALRLTAERHSSHRAELAARVVDAAMVAPRFERLVRDAQGTAIFESTIERDSGIPRDLGMQCENAYLNLRDRGLVDPPVGISDDRVCTYLRRTAHYDDGCGCTWSLPHLERLNRMDETTVRRVAAYLRTIGMEQDFERVSVDSRKVAGSPDPGTEHRTTVRRFYPIPLALADRLSEDEQLALITPPRVRRTGAVSEAAAKAAAEPRKRVASLEDALVLWGELSPRERAFLPGVKALAGLTGCWISPGLLVAETERQELELGDGIAAVEELAERTRREITVRASSGKPPWRYWTDSLAVRCLEWIGLKRRWKASSPLAAAERAAEVSQREARYRDAYKSPEQNEREHQTARQPAGSYRPVSELERAANRRNTQAMMRAEIEHGSGNAGLAAEATARAPAVAPPREPSAKAAMSPVQIRRLGILEQLILHEDDPVKRKELELERERLMVELGSSGRPPPE